MRRFLFMVVACIGIGCLSQEGLAQYANDDASGEAALLMAQNPLLVTLERQQPGSLSGTINSLRRMTAGKREDSFRTLNSPTEQERVQIAANPAFAAAWSTHPREALSLLRELNAALEKPRP